ncbi:hypothetical protein Hypma_002788 [Hypsizygus marmoreus]|uniref:Uncharacterized protein n=1 Tax=Hypsizygus marmoreus TaxID=39966 RepID=A0A369JC81_HYPMA|nr:hypothetical protein Hypma_002788 [Hypsizygus marmoreus]
MDSSSTTSSYPDEIRRGFSLTLKSFTGDWRKNSTPSSGAYGTHVSPTLLRPLLQDRQLIYDTHARSESLISISQPLVVPFPDGPS